MKSTIWKSTFREIRQSFGRFFAILAIVALGVGLFAGLKVTKSAMVETTQNYFTEKQFFDYRLLSTLGFEQEDVDFFQSQPNVRAAEGSVTLDIICQSGDSNELVLKAHSLNSTVNIVEITEGRMPDSPDECVVDANLFSGKQVGDKITLVSNNEEKDLEKFAYREYTISGIVKSPYYIQFERGNTSIGNGTVSGFLYLMPEGFNVDYYTEVFVKFQEDMPIYSQEYKQYMAEQELIWEPLTQQAGERRYDAVVKEAGEELADAGRELDEKETEARQELAEAENKLKDAEEKLADGQTKLDEGKAELKDADNTISEKEKELADAEKEIAEKEKELTEGEKELADNIALWKENDAQAESAKQEINEKQQQLNGQLASLEEQAKLLEGSEAELTAQDNTLKAQEDQLTAKSGELDELEAQLKEAYGTVPEPYASQIAAGRQEIQAGREALLPYREQITALWQQVEQGKAGIENGRSVIEGFQEQINAGRSQVMAADSKLGEAWKQIEDAGIRLADGRVQLTDGRVQLEDGRKQLNHARSTLSDGQKELKEKEQELLDGQEEYQEGRREYEDALQEFNAEIADAEAKIEDARQEIADIKKPDTYVLGRETNVGYVCFENDSGIVEGIANIFPIFFFAVAALVCITTMNRMVEEQRTQIGVMKALGYGESVIMNKYLFYSGGAAFIGCLAGFFGGTYLFPRVIWTAYGIMYKVTPLIYVFDWNLALISLGVSLACSMGTTWLSCRYELSQVAAELMRPKAPRSGKRVLFEYIPFLWKRLKFLQKVSVRNIFRYKKRFFMMVIGISGCTALLVTGFGIKDSIANVAVQQFEEILIYDIGVSLADPIDQEMEQKLKEALGDKTQGYTSVMEKSIDLEDGDKIKGINLIVWEPDQDMKPFISLHTTGEDSIAFPENGEAVLSHKIAGQFSLKNGESIMLREEDRTAMGLKLSGITENFVSNYVYVNADTYRESMGREPEYKTVYINLEEGADAHELSAALMKLDGVTGVSVNKDIMDRFSSMMKSLDLIVLVVIMCAAGLAFIVLYNLTNINITERVREIATIKVLGFYKSETSSYVFRENIALTLIGTGVGLLLGRLLHIFVMNEINIDMVAFDIQVRPLSYLYSILLTLGFAFFVNLIMGRKLEHISMTESLKSVD